jgi:signal transduction histidine kinase
LPELVEEESGGAPPAPESAAAARGGLGAPELRRLTSALGHELRNPLTAVRTFIELLPERHGDPSFRDAFGQLALRSLDRVEAALGRIARVADLGPPAGEAVDVGALLEQVLDARRERAHERRLLVLEELDRSHPLARGDSAQLRLAFEALLDECLELVPERGDLYLASRRDATGTRARPGVRVLLRFRGPEGTAGAPGRAELAPAAHSLGFAIAELLIRAQGGSLTVDTAERHETVLVADLPG